MNSDIPKISDLISTPTQVVHAILNTIQQGYKEKKVLVEAVLKVLGKVMPAGQVPTEKYVQKRLAKLAAEGYLVKEDVAAENATIYTFSPEGEELFKTTSKQVNESCVYILTEGIKMPLGVVEDIFKSYEVVMAAVPEMVKLPRATAIGLGEIAEKTFFNIVFSLKVADREQRIALRFPRADDHNHLSLNKPNYDYNVFNAFATFMTINGVQVLISQQETNPNLIEEGYYFKLEEYDPHNPPDKFDLIRNEHLDVVLEINKAKPKSGA
jgi:hypothetical protein